MALTIVPIAVLAVVYGVLAVFAWRRPLLARLAVREAVRRPGQSALFVFGMMFGTAAILAMQGVFDSFVNVNTNNILLGWGRTDITVSQNGGLFNDQVARDLAADPKVAAGAAGIQGGLLFIGSVADTDQRLSASPAQVVSFDSGQPRFGAFDLKDGRSIDGSSLGPNDVILSPALATRVQAHVGDSVQINFAVAGHVQRLTAKVAGITRVGVSGVLDQQPGIFVPLRSMQALVGDGSVNMVRISAKGDGMQEVDNARALAPAVRAAVAALPTASRLEVREVKAEGLTSTRKGLVNLRPAALALSLFVVLAASALVVNLTLALAEERRPRLAVLRALGLTRFGLVMAALFEGALYSLAAGLVGILPGLAYIYYVDSRPLSGTTGLIENGGFSIFNVTSDSISLSVCLGVLITLATILIVTVRNSRMAISSAIRDLPDPAPPKQRSLFGKTWPFLFAAAGVALSLSSNPVSRMFAGAALILAGAAFIRGRVSERVRASLVGAALAAWPVITIYLAPQSLGFGSAVVLATAGLVMCVLGAAILLSANLRLMEPVTWLFSARLVASIRIPLAYLARRPMRSGLATGAFALILASLAFFAVLLPSVAPDAKTITSGYDVRVRTLGADAFALPDSLRGQVVDTESIATLAYIGPMNLEQQDFTTSGWGSHYAELYPFTPAQLSRPPVALGMRDPQYSSDAAVWRATQNDPTLVVATGGGGLGYVSLVGPNGVVRLHIIGVLAGLILSDQQSPSYIGTPSTFSGLAARGAGWTVLIKTARWVDSTAFALTLRRATFDQGVDAISGPEIFDQNNQGTRWFIGFFLTLLQAAVIVGVLSLGILAFRAAIERRRAIGVMRALGYRPGQVLSGLLVESTVNATIGIGVGLAVGIGLTSLVQWRASGGAAVTQVDAGVILIPTLLIYVTVWLVTIGPAIRASRLPASEALRIVG